MIRLLTHRAALPIAAAVAFAAGCAITAGLLLPRIDRAQAETKAAQAETAAAEAQGQANVASLIAAHAQAVIDAVAASQEEARKREQVLQDDLDRIQRDAAARGPTRIRVPVPGLCPGPGAGGDPAGAAPGGDGAAADGPRVGGDGPGGDRAPDVTLDVAGIWRLVDAGKAVSARLRACQDTLR